MVYLIMEKLGFSLEFCHVFLRMATGDFFMCGPNSWDFFPTSKRVEHLLSVWVGAGYPDILSKQVSSAERAGTLPCHDHWL